VGRTTAAIRAATRRKEVRVSGEMEMEDFIVDLKRKVAVVEEQNQLLREENSRLLLALDDALALVRQYRREAHPGMNVEAHEL
jgi:hypothetical protein